MNYEQKYNEALKRAKYALTTDMDNSGHWAVNYIFPELKESEDERIRKGIIDFIKHESDIYGIKTWCRGYTTEEIISWLEKQGEKKSVDEVRKIRQELYQSGYNDGYKHGQEDIAISLEKESIDALEHFVRSIGESGYASPYDNRIKLVYSLLGQLKQIVK